jgi:hypothetical protein
MSRYTVKYRTFDQFMYDVEDDLSSYADQGLIDRDKVLKVIQKCNSVLSLKINPKRNAILTLVNSKVALPSDFKLFSAAYICTGQKRYKLPEIEKEYTTTYIDSSTCDTCNSTTSCTCDQVAQTVCVIKRTEEAVVEITGKFPLYLTEYKNTCDDCENTVGSGSLDEIYIEQYKGNYYILSNLIEGDIYLEYIAEMVTKDDILILDHPLVIEYYEYAVKERILEDIWLNGKEDVVNRYRMMEEKHRRSKIDAVRFVRTPDFREIKKIYEANRERFSTRYFDPLYFKRMYN